LNKWRNTLNTTHQASETTCRPLTISKGRNCWVRLGSSTWNVAT